MNVVHMIRWCTVTAVVAWGALTGLSQPVSAQPPPQSPPVEHQDGIEVLTRGPVHEAFAETVTFDPQPDVVIPKSPPKPIEEIAPGQRPEGNNVDWIPGYWGWDDERNDFVSISGIWRALPPGRQWIPGYWGQSGQGFQWTSGYWADAQANAVQYLPEPPATIEAGPNIAAQLSAIPWTNTSGLAMPANRGGRSQCTVTTRSVFRQV